MSLHRIRVMVADDHPAISLGISYELSQCGSLEMLGQVSNSTELIGRLNEGDCDVVIVDYTMPGGKYGDGLALLSLLRRRYPHLQLVVFTMLNNPVLSGPFSSRVSIASSASPTRPVTCWRR